MQRAEIRKKIDALVKESRNLKISINELKDNLLKRHDTLPSQQTERDNFESRASHSVSKSTENPKRLTKNLNISEWINKIIYTNDEINVLDDGLCQYIADAVTGSVTFQVEFVVEDMKDKGMIVRSLKVVYLNPFHEAELKSFSRTCMRQKSLQTLIRGVVSYAERFTEREEVTNWLSEENKSHFSVTKHPENEACNVFAKAKGRTQSYFSCEWKIIWDEGCLNMTHHFTVRANNKTDFYKENEYLFSKITSPAATPQEVTELWHKIAQAVITENELAKY